MRRLRVSADYFAFPLWDFDSGGMVDSATLPICPEIVARLQAWADRFDETLDLEDPPESGFATRAEAEAFARDGEQLARALQIELGPDFDVHYGT